VASLKLLVKSLLSQKPWLHDPLCLEIPWRNDQEEEIRNILSWSMLAFGVMKHDGVVTPHPPVQRAMDIVIKTLENLGHKVIEWSPPSHKRGIDIITTIWAYDGGADVHEALGLSGEPPIPQIAGMFGSKPREQADATKIAATNVTKRKYQKEYMEYWNSTIDSTGTGRPVDALIMPVAPFEAARPESYNYYGYSSIFNILDYSSCVVPVTSVDKAIDLVDKNFKPLDDLDKEVADICKAFPSICVNIAYPQLKMIPRFMMAHTSRFSLWDEGYRKKRYLLWPSLLAGLLLRPNEPLRHRVVGHLWYFAKSRLHMRNCLHCHDCFTSLEFKQLDLVWECGINRLYRNRLV